MPLQCGGVTSTALSPPWEGALLSSMHGCDVVWTPSSHRALTCTRPEPPSNSCHLSPPVSLLGVLLWHLAPTWVPSDTWLSLTETQGCQKLGCRQTMEGTQTICHPTSPCLHHNCTDKFQCKHLKVLTLTKLIFKSSLPNMKSLSHGMCRGN